ncbi:MAG: transposase [Candidatus Omnitrophota bacterium]|jgi:REP element-mobilizing transposase RayT
MSELPTRRNTNHVPQHDYSKPGQYFVTICVENRKQLFGTIQNNEIVLNDIGNMIDFWWQEMFKKYKNIFIDQYVIMPNHIHGIINIVGADLCIGPVQNNNINAIDNKNHIDSGKNIVLPLQYKELGQYISWFKRMAANEYIKNVKNNNWPPFNKRLWQRNYYDHIIRNDRSLDRIRAYIANNPKIWDNDIENPNRIGNIESELIKV